MNLFKIIWNKLKSLFFRQSNIVDDVIFEEKKVLNEGLPVKDLYDKIVESNDEKEKIEIFEQISNIEVAQEIIEYIGSNATMIELQNKGRKKVYDLNELRVELKKLKEQKIYLSIAESKIQYIQYLDNSKLEAGINNLINLQNKHKKGGKAELNKRFFLELRNEFNQSEKQVSCILSVGRHNIRERERKKQKEIYERNIKKELQSLEALISQNKIQEAKSLAKSLTNTIKPDYKRGLERLSKLITRIKEKELEVFKKRQEVLLRIQQEEAEVLRLEQKRKYEQQLIERDKVIEKKKKEEEEKLLKKNKLVLLLNKKSNWRDFQRVLQENNISILYHFTDFSNLKSIKENGGLFSWYYCGRNNIIIPMTGNSALGRSLDVEFGLEDYVRLSFIKDHPMKHVAISEGRITKPYLLKVSIEVCFFQNTRFSNMNAADKRHSNDDSVDFLASLNFDLFNKKYFDLNSIDKKKHQAEVLVKTWIPIEYITNLNEIV